MKLLSLSCVIARTSIAPTALRADPDAAARVVETVLAGLDARTWLAEHDDDAVLDIAWRCAPDVHEERHTMPGALDPTAIVLRQGKVVFDGPSADGVEVLRRG